MSIKMTDKDPSREITDIDIAKLAQANEHFRTLDKEIPAQVIATFLYVASHDDCNKVDLEKALTFSTASGSRNTSVMCHVFTSAGNNLVFVNCGCFCLQFVARRLQLTKCNHYAAASS